MERKVKICKTAVCFIVLVICAKCGVPHVDSALCWRKTV